MLRPLSSGLGFGLTTPRIASSLAPVAGMSLWLTSSVGVLDSSGNPCTDGVGVKTWQDQSGNGFNATQATSGNQPLFKTAIVNGKPIIRFNGTTSWLSHVFTIPSAASIFAAFSGGSPISPNTYSVLFEGTPPSSALHSRVDAYQTGSVVAISSSTTFSSSYSASSFSIGTFTNNGTAVTLTMNANATQSGTISIYSGDSFDRRSIGSDANGLLAFLNGDIAEIIVYSSLLSTANQNSNRAYLDSLYAVY